MDAKDVSSSPDIVFWGPVLDTQRRPHLPVVSLSLWLGLNGLSE